MWSASGFSVLCLWTDKCKINLAIWLSALLNSKLKVIRKCVSKSSFRSKSSKYRTSLILVSLKWLCIIVDIDTESNLLFWVRKSFIYRPKAATTILSRITSSEVFFLISLEHAVWCDMLARCELMFMFMDKIGMRYVCFSLYHFCLLATFSGKMQNLF